MKILISVSSAKDWFKNLTKKEQDDYIKKHPNSKYAKKKIKNTTNTTLYMLKKIPGARVALHESGNKGSFKLPGKDSIDFELGPNGSLKFSMYDSKYDEEPSKIVTIKDAAEFKKFVSKL